MNIEHNMNGIRTEMVEHKDRLIHIKDDYVTERNRKKYFNLKNQNHKNALCFVKNHPRR
jgi:hypothetical protein